ncbi:hypothetical protein MGYG_01599 [Nannizzia gypsea CBS 118893]|uniref:Uncharacterized protein n=1 Tax=Arthroderma gypseum (strain ATCC MYA-4604 / CBS 118893) TaxID=535722 RepID=E5R1T9_ARTGP|nr:hypothetical protein MGYG_01599 [Nannizzia gypsea CBS 118893]EFQ98573.1 hypothetical protein MGYG_01599 [Nannizzia gypsea CBS 118893]
MPQVSQHLGTYKQKGRILPISPERLKHFLVNHKGSSGRMSGWKSNDWVYGVQRPHRTYAMGRMSIDLDVLDSAEESKSPRSWLWICLGLRDRLCWSRESCR